MRTLNQWLAESGNLDQLLDQLVPEHRRMRMMSHAYARQHLVPRIRVKAEELGVQIEPHEVEQVLSHILGPEVELPKFDIDFYNRHC